MQPVTSALDQLAGQLESITQEDLETAYEILEAKGEHRAMDYLTEQNEDREAGS